MSRQKIPDAVRAAIIADAKAGTPDNVIAERYGLSRGHVGAIRRSEGIPARLRRPTLDQQAEIVYRHDLGQTGAAIARDLGLSPAVVYAAIKRASATTVRIRPRPATDLSWQERGACLNADPEIFHPKTAEGRHVTARDWAIERANVRDAKAICATCPVIDACLDWAITTNDEHAVLGGTTPKERRRMKRRSVA